MAGTGPAIGTEMRFTVGTLADQAGCETNDAKNSNIRRSA